MQRLRWLHCYVPQVACVRGQFIRGGKEDRWEQELKRELGTSGKAVGVVNRIGK